MTEARVRELLAAFPSRRVVVVGDVMLDRYVFGNVDRISPEAPVPILRAGEEKDRLGGAGNTAKNLAHLGARTTFVSVVGVDAAGERLRSVLESEGIEPLLAEDASRPTTEKIRYLQKGYQLLRVDYEVRTPLQAEVEEALLRELQRALGGADAVVVSDYAKGTITKRIAGTLMKICKERNLLVAVDAKPANARLFQSCSLMSPNLREAREFLRKDPLHDRTPSSDLARELASEFQTDAYVTLGEKGIAVSCLGAEVEAVPQVHAREVADTSGAGDTAVSALTLALLSGASPKEAAEFANAACAVVVAKVGASSASPKEVLEAVNRRVFVAQR